MNNNTPTFGNVLRGERVLRKLTQTNLADMLDTKQQTVAGWEAGKSVPGSRYHDALVEIFGRDSPIAALPKRGDMLIPVEAKNGHIEQNSVVEDPQTVLLATWPQRPPTHACRHWHKK